ncbi:MAG: hypothetical protein RIS86_1573 [Planctomycetota bacterium]
MRLAVFEDGDFDAHSDFRVDTVTLRDERHEPFREVFADVAKAAMRVQATLHGALRPRLPVDFSARSFARLLKLDKSLGWHIHRMTFASDPAAVLSALPGKRGLRSLREGLVNAGCAADAIVAVDGALDDLQRTIETRRISSRELRAMASGGLDSDTQRRETARRQRAAHEANAALRGSSITDRVASYLVAPSQSAGKVDLAALSLICGVVKIRPCGPLPAYIPTQTIAGGSEPSARGGPLGDDPRCPYLHRPSTSADLADSELLDEPVPTPSADRVYLVDAAEHRKTPLHLGFGEVVRAVGSATRTEQDRMVNLVKPVLGPTRHLTYDILYHRSLPAVEPSAACYAHLAPQHLRIEFSELARLPVVLESGWAKGTAIRGNAVLHGAYQSLLERGAEALDSKLEDFRVFRVTIEHPPAPLAVRVRWNLP